MNRYFFRVTAFLLYYTITACPQLNSTGTLVQLHFLLALLTCCESGEQGVSLNMTSAEQLKLDYFLS